ncbi:MAG: L,D-transpeptidase [Aeriscardovia sp.]|nr:L,D-transpeptidase [Aeriscardovia sp.]
MAVEGTKAKKKGGWIALWIVLGVTVAATISDGCVGGFYLKDRAPLGTSFVGQSVAGDTRAQVKRLVAEKIASSKILLTGNGKTATMDYRTLGVTADEQRTVDAIMGAKGNDPFAKADFLQKTNIPLQASVDATSLRRAIDSALVGDDVSMKDPSVVYDAARGEFIVTPGRSGQSISLTDVESSVEATFSQPAGTAVVPVTVSPAQPPISNEAAEQAAQKANRMLSCRYVISNGSTKTFDVPASAVASWVSAEPDEAAGTVNVTVDRKALDSYMASMLPSKLNQGKQNEVILVTPSGGRIPDVPGVDGLQVSQPSAVAEKVYQALESGRSLTTVAPMKTVDFTVDDKPVPNNFGVANGSPWLQLDLSTQTVTAYRGTTQVATFNVSTGRAGHYTANGTFYVYEKYLSQTMRGPGYVTPDVKWVSYFNDGDAFHGAPWNLTGIATGTPRSHGCANMTVANAQWIYDFAPLGTKVVVIGTTPSGAVR